jgi:hypothetical protein
VVSIGVYKESKFLNNQDIPYIIIFFHHRYPRGSWGALEDLQPFFELGSHSITHVLINRQQILPSVCRERAHNLLGPLLIFVPNYQMSHSITFSMNKITLDLQP